MHVSAGANHKPFSSCRAGTSPYKPSIARLARDLAHVPCASGRSRPDSARRGTAMGSCMSNQARWRLQAVHRTA